MSSNTSYYIKNGRFYRITTEEQDLGSQDSVFSEMIGNIMFPVLLDLPLSLDYGSGFKPLTTFVNAIFTNKSPNIMYWVVQLPVLDVSSVYLQHFKSGDCAYEKPVSEENPVDVAYPVWGQFGETLPQKEGSFYKRKFLPVSETYLVICVNADSCVIEPYLLTRLGKNKWIRTPYCNVYESARVCMGDSFVAKDADFKEPVKALHHVVNNYIGTRPYRDLWDSYLEPLYAVDPTGNTHLCPEFLTYGKEIYGKSNEEQSSYIDSLSLPDSLKNRLKGVIYDAPRRRSANLAFGPALETIAENTVGKDLNMTLESYQETMKCLKII